MILVIFVGLVVVVWAFIGKQKQLKAVQAFNALEWASPWLQQQGFDEERLIYSSYDDAALAENAGAIILVGTSVYKADKRAGFYLEVVPKFGVVLGEVFQPDGIVSWHKIDANFAKIRSLRLIDVIRERAVAHQKMMQDLAIKKVTAAVMPSIDIARQNTAVTKNGKEKFSVFPEARMSVERAMETGMARMIGLSDELKTVRAAQTVTKIATVESVLLPILIRHLETAINADSPLRLEIRKYLMSVGIPATDKLVSRFNLTLAVYSLLFVKNGLVGVGVLENDTKRFCEAIRLSLVDIEKRSLFPEIVKVRIGDVTINQNESILFCCEFSVMKTVEELSDLYFKLSMILPFLVATRANEFDKSIEENARAAQAGTVESVYFLWQWFRSGMDDDMQSVIESSLPYFLEAVNSDTAHHVQRILKG